MRRTASFRILGGALGFPRRPCVGLAAFLCCVVGSRSARAQIVSDQVPRERLVSEQEQVKSDMERSRLRLGPVRILPSVSVPTAGYDSNIFGSVGNPVGDWTATVSAGARFLVPLGSKVYLRANAFPQYTWYATLSDRNSLGGVYDASLLGFFNHAFLELKGFYTESYQIYSSQLPALALVKTQGGTGNLELQVSSHVSIFASGLLQTIAYTQPGATLPGQIEVQLNDRTDNAVRSGIHYLFSSQWKVGALVEETWSDFEFVPETRNNRSTGYLVTMDYNQPKFYVNLTGGYREGRAIDNSFFPSYSTPTGSLFASYFPIRWLEIQAYGHRRVTYSVTTPLQPYYFENRGGGGLNIQALPRVLLRGFAEEGPNNYPLREPFGQGTITRKETVLTYGGGLSIHLVGNAVLSGVVTRNVYSSNIPSNNRSYDTFIANLSFNGEFQR